MSSNYNKSNEEIVKEFGNSLAFQLKPSNDTMEAVRLARKELLPILDAKDQAHKAEVEEAVREESIRLFNLSKGKNSQEFGRIVMNYLHAKLLSSPESDKTE